MNKKLFKQNVLKAAVLCLAAIACTNLTTSCSHSDDDEDIDENIVEGGDEGGDEGGTQKGKKGSTVSLSNQSPLELTVKCEMGKDVAYYTFKFDDWAYNNTHYTKDREFKVDKLRPDTEHDVMMVTYDKNDAVLESIMTTFKTSKPPYTNYMYFVPDYGTTELFRITGIKMWCDQEWSSTGTNWKFIKLETNGSIWLQMGVGVHTWEAVNNYWESGRYSITYPASYYQYFVSSNYAYGYKGTFTIRNNYNSLEIDFDLKETQTSLKYECFGHCEGLN